MLWYFRKGVPHIKFIKSLKSPGLGNNPNMILHLELHLNAKAIFSFGVFCYEFVKKKLHKINYKITDVIELYRC